MKTISSIILDFSPPERADYSSLRPLLAYAFLKGISAVIIHSYLRDNNVVVSLTNIKIWRRDASKWLGMEKKSAGRPSLKEQEEIIAQWYAKHGEPTLQNFVNGWEPGQPIPSVEKTTKPQVTKSRGDVKRQSKMPSIPPLKPSPKVSEEDILSQLTKPT